MSKQLGFGESSGPPYAPLTPPPYSEVMYPSAADMTETPEPEKVGPLQSPSVQPQSLQGPMTQSAPQSMPMSVYTPGQGGPVEAPAPVTNTLVFTSLGRDSTMTVCHACQKQVLTATSSKNKCLAYCCCCLLFWSVFGLICSCIPFCMDSCKIVKHECPNCGAMLGTYRS